MQHKKLCFFIIHNYSSQSQDMIPAYEKLHGTTSYNRYIIYTLDWHWLHKKVLRSSRISILSIFKFSCERERFVRQGKTG